MWGELLARIRAVTRRTTEPELVEPVQLGRWTVDLSDHVIYETLRASAGPQVHLTPTEWQLLQALVRHPGRLVSQRQLLQEVWGPTYLDQTTIHVSTSRHSGTSLKMIPVDPATSSPNLEWVIGSSPNAQ